MGTILFPLNNFVYIMYDRNGNQSFLKVDDRFFGRLSALKLFVFSFGDLFCWCFLIY